MLVTSKSLQAVDILTRMPVTALIVVPRSIKLLLAILARLILWWNAVHGLHVSIELHFQLVVFELFLGTDEHLPTLGRICVQSSAENVDVGLVRSLYTARILLYA